MAAAARTLVAKKQYIGKLLEWKGKYGWIKAVEEIDHPEAAKRGGKIYVGQEDVEEEITVKGHVRFKLYVDETGLGAMNCRAAKEPVGVGKGNVTQAAKGGAKGGMLAPKAGKGATAAGKGAASGKGAAAGKGPTPPSGAPPHVGPITPPGWGKGKGKSLITPPGGASNTYGSGVLKTIIKKPGGNPLGKGTLKGRGKGGATPEPIETLGADGEERAPPPPPDKTNRTPVSNKRVTGKMIRWRGTIGWIKPSEPIDHPQAKKRGLYIHQVDVQNGHEMFQGAFVNFFVYADDNGLGAQHVMLVKDQEAAAAAAAEKAAANQAANGQGTGKRSAAKEGKGQDNKNVELVKNLRLKQKKGGKGKKGKGEERERKPCGPDLPRERITEIPVQGEVIEWRKSFGWLKPVEPIEHEKADVHEGKIYCHKKDVVGEIELEAGTTVEFHVYVDANSLGAEECLAN